jgi:hypothetical protein
VQERLIAAACDDSPVAGLTHNFYRYPARFSPEFARAAIECFSKPGDLVLDPFVGGGTSLVEALSLGRDAVGVDISSLAEFVATVKTTVFSGPDLVRLAKWANELPDVINIRSTSRPFEHFAEAGYFKHMDTPPRWRLRKCIEQAVWSAQQLSSKRLEAFGRCAVLCTAQWALDARRRLPSVEEFREKIVFNAHEMIVGARRLAASIKHEGPKPTIRILNRSAARLEDDAYVGKLRPPKLVVTSPPYPGIHILYHRWQVDGRKEAPLPFMIANKLDGAGSSYYTMGDRKYPELKTYFDNIRATMSSIAALADSRTIVVQMVAFSTPEWQVKRYLATMEEAGLKEIFLPVLNGQGDGRLWRSVPGRRWYNDLRDQTSGSQEVVLFHRKAANVPIRRAQGISARPRPSI